MRNLNAVVVAVAALGLGGCVVAPYPRNGGYYGGQNGGGQYGGQYGGQPATVYDQEIAVANVAPPPAQYEVIPVIPFLGAVWLSGYWGWSSGRHNWVGGHWSQPRSGYGWQPHRWVPGNGGRWHLRGGGWIRH